MRNVYHMTFMNGRSYISEKKVNIYRYIYIYLYILHELVYFTLLQDIIVYKTNLKLILFREHFKNIDCVQML